MKRKASPDENLSKISATANDLDLDESGDEDDDDEPLDRFKRGAIVDDR